MRCGLIGEHLGHSFSPEVHRCFADYAYRLIELVPDEVAAFLAARDFDGLNVTVPYKRTVMAHCDVLSDTAARIGSVNTIVNRGGVLTGYNTDAYGFLRMADAAGIGFSGRKVLVLGTGGAARTAVYASLLRGARQAVTVSRSDRGDTDYAGAVLRHGDAELIVNATPVGMFPHAEASPIALEGFSACRGVLDLVANPFRTALLAEAARRGIPCAGGLTMLIAQARRAAELFTGQPIDPALEQAALSRIRREKENLLLIGMPGCGKSTVARLIAARMGRTCIDLDEAVRQDTGKTPEQLLNESGEPALRAAECRAAQRVGAGFSCVIASGGGTVVAQAAMDALRGNARTVYLTCALDRLDRTGRPLSNGGVPLRALYEARAPLYARYADFCTDNDGAASDAADRIVRWFSKEEGSCAFSSSTGRT